MISGISFRLKLSQCIRDCADVTAPVLKSIFQRNRFIMDLLLRVNDRVLTLPKAAWDRKYKKFVLSADNFTGDPGVNLVGYINSESGVGEGARANIRSLERSGVPFALNNLKGPSRQADATYTKFMDANPYRVNLVHVNADAVPDFLHKKGINCMRGKYNIAFWYWELSKFPEVWSDRFRFFHEIWVASSFCRDAIAAASPMPVIKIPPSVVVDNVKDMKRGDFGLMDDEFVFLFIFDLWSFLDRKNPFALIRAFRDAFPAKKDAKLVLKCSNMDSRPEVKERLLKETKGLNVKFIDGYLDKDEVHALMKLSDCYASLHRSEGFGLPLAEAMYLGKPVIATGYSSNVDFMNANNSLLVKYSLTEIEKDIGPYKKGNVWAEPDHAHAVELMRRVYDDRSFGAKLGAQAAKDIRTNLSPEATGRLISERLSKLPVWN